MQELTLEAKIEAILFYKGEPMQIKQLASFFKVSKEEIEKSLNDLEATLNGRGIVLMRKEDSVTLATPPSLGKMIETLRKEELSKELSKASLETLSIILYKRGATRGEIDYIRGVNSSFILRNLLVRGLIEKEVHKDDSRKYFYKPTFDMMGFLGIKNLSELPEYEMLSKTLDREATAPVEEN